MTTTIAGREFAFVSGNIDLAHAGWVRSQLRLTNILHIVREFEEGDASYTVRIFDELCKHPEPFRLMGGLLLPASLPPSEWSPWVAASTAAHLQSVADPEEKAAMRDYCIASLIHFCLLQPTLHEG